MAGATCNCRAAIDSARRVSWSAVDVLSVRTYDERSGLLNPFSIDDRDAIRGQIRAQLVAAATSSGLLPKADTSAREVLRTLLSRDGYTVDVGLPGLALDRAPAP